MILGFILAVLAGRWLGLALADATREPLCPSTWTRPDGSGWFRCRKPRGHDGPHTTVVDGREVTWPNG
jgi:hypothetical protein